MSVQRGTKVEQEPKSEMKTCGVLALVCSVQGELLALGFTICNIGQSRRSRGMNQRSTGPVSQPELGPILTC